MLKARRPIEDVSAQFLLEHGQHDTDSIMRGKAAVAFHNGNFKELYSIMEGRWAIIKNGKNGKFIAIL